MFSSISTQCSTRGTLLLMFSMSQYMQIYAFNTFISSLQHLPLTFYRFRGAGNVSTPITITTTPSHHHPLVPKGLSTQINWKKEECTVVLPLHLSGRESRRGRTHGPYRGTISLHLSRTVSSLMGWNIARKYIYFYISSVRISLLSPKPSTNSQKYTQWLLVSDYSPPTRRALSNHLANYAFKSNCIKKNPRNYRRLCSELLMKGKECRVGNLHLNSYKMTVQSSRPESLAKKNIYCLLRGKKQ